MIKLGLNRDRTIQVPANVREVGWWSGGGIPGKPGAAVIVGHVDSRVGPGVFYNLPHLADGQKVIVVAKSGARTTFVVTGRKQVPKADFPTTEVYAKTRRPTIRLITCTGEFDAASGHYRDNLIVFGKRV